VIYLILDFLVIALSCLMLSGDYTSEENGGEKF
jgi:hypothetical protein